MGYTYKKELEVKKNAVFQKVAPLFSQLKIAELEKPGSENVADTPEPIKPAKIIPKDPTPPKAAIVATSQPTSSVAAKSIPNAKVVGSVAKVGISSIQPLVKKPITALAASAITRPTANGQPVAVQKSQISLPKGATPIMKRSDEQAKRSTTPNKK